MRALHEPAWSEFPNNSEPLPVEIVSGTIVGHDWPVMSGENTVFKEFIKDAIREVLAEYGFNKEGGTQ